MSTTSATTAKNRRRRPAATYSSTCIPRELQAFYRRHIPEGSDSDDFRAVAAEYALTVCQPAADR